MLTVAEIAAIIWKQGYTHVCIPYLHFLLSLPAMFELHTNVLFRDESDHLENSWFTKNWESIRC